MVSTLAIVVQRFSADIFAVRDCGASQSGLRIGSLGLGTSANVWFTDHSGCHRGKLPDTDSR